MCEPVIISDDSYNDEYSDEETGDDSYNEEYSDEETEDDSYNDTDIEAFEYECLTLEQIDDLLRSRTFAPAQISKERLRPVYRSTRPCPICFKDSLRTRGHSLDCGHQFCADCWTAFLEFEIGQGRSKDIACMQQGCEILATREFVLQFTTLQIAHLQSRYL